MMGMLEDVGHPHPAFAHQALIHRGAVDFAEQLAAPLAGALAGGGAVLVCSDHDSWSELAGRLSDDAHSVRYVPADRRYASPNEALRMLHEFAVEATAAGASAAWSVGAIPYDGTRDDDWHRYEAAVDTVLAHLPLRAVCAYDLDSASEELLDVAARTHEYAFDQNDGTASRAYAPMTLTDGLPVVPPAHEPVIAAAVDSPSMAREALVSALDGDVAPDVLADIALATSELVTNSLRHGAPPVTMTAWCDTARVVVDVHDHGRGVDDPFFDLRPPRRDRAGGVGLWIVGQVSDRVRVRRRDDGTRSVTLERSLS